jgi:hypothetical protein
VASPQGEPGEGVYNEPDARPLTPTLPPGG